MNGNTLNDQHSSPSGTISLSNVSSFENNVGENTGGADDKKEERSREEDEIKDPKLKEEVELGKKFNDSSVYLEDKYSYKMSHGVPLYPDKQYKSVNNLENTKDILFKKYGELDFTKLIKDKLLFV